MCMIDEREEAFRHCEEAGQRAIEWTRNCIKSRGNVRSDILKRGTWTRDDIPQQREVVVELLNKKQPTEEDRVALSAVCAYYYEVGQCGEYASFAYAFLRSLKVPVGKIYLVCHHPVGARDNHAFVVIRPTGNDTAIIVDPWKNEKCEYEQSMNFDDVNFNIQVEGKMDGTDITAIAESKFQWKSFLELEYGKRMKQEDVPVKEPKEIEDIRRNPMLYDL